MLEEIDAQSAVDAEHLKFLSWGYIVSGVIAACASIVGLLYLLMGVFMGLVFTSVPGGKAARMLPALAATLFAGLGLVFFVLMVGMAIGRFWAAHCLQQRRSRTFCIVVAAVTCMEFPLGTALGVLSLVVLLRPSVATLFTVKS
jgi:hypothetical protein